MKAKEGGCASGFWYFQFVAAIWQVIHFFSFVWRLINMRKEHFTCIQPICEPKVSNWVSIIISITIRMVEIIIKIGHYTRNIFQRLQSFVWFLFCFKPKKMIAFIVAVVFVSNFYQFTETRTLNLVWFLNSFWIQLNARSYKIYSIFAYVPLQTL